MFHSHVHPPEASTCHAQKRRASKSPSPPSKRRAPPSYVPSIYSPIPTSISSNPSYQRSLSLEANPNGEETTPISERSSPGLDWLQRTEDLKLATPTNEWTRGIEGGGDDSVMETDPTTFHDMQDSIEEDPHHHSYSPHPAMPLSSRSTTCSPYPPHPHPHPPHEAPPLYNHLAGSPSSTTSMTRSVSDSSSIRGGDYETTLLPHILEPFPNQTISYETTTTTQNHDNDVSMDPSGVHQAGGGGNSGGKRGWKITMGYRPDCEKCLQRLPGHYSHVVYTS
ncbi:hypothetical protein JCM16303_003341 [Sporobolomyces ruberrimus]